MNLKIERYYPHFVALASGAGWFWLRWTLPTDEKEFLAAALSLGAVLTGFIATAQAILMALPSDSVMGRLRAGGYIPDLVGYISAALTAGIIFCVLCLVGFYLISVTAEQKRFFSTAWVTIGIFGLLAFHRVTYILMRIMRN